MAVTQRRPDIDIFDYGNIAYTQIETQRRRKSRRPARPPLGLAKKTVALGKHVTIECYDCDERIINSAENLEQACLKVVANTGATILSSTFRQFSPQGVSGIIIISESHFSVHTWPEHNYAAVDFFTCGDTISIPRGIDGLKEAFHTDAVIVSADMARGIVGNNGVERHVPVCEDSHHVFTLSWKEKFEESKAWGLLTSIDVHHCDPEKIRDADHVKRYVRELCDRIEMKRFQDTVVVHFGEEERVAGFSMMQLIETSLVSGHFANQTNRAYIDIFSCKFYEPRQAAEFTLEAFGGEHYQMQVALRS